MSIDIIRGRAVSVDENFRVYIETRPVNLWYCSEKETYTDSSGNEIVGLKGKSLEEALVIRGYL